MNRIALIAVLCGFSMAAFSADDVEFEPADQTAVWQAWGAEGQLTVYHDTLEPIGVSIYRGKTRIPDGSSLNFRGLDTGSLEFYAPVGNFDRFLGGALVFQSDFALGGPDGTVEVTRLQVVADPTDARQLLLKNERGQVLFVASHTHVYTMPEQGLLMMERMDVRMADSLADRLGVERGHGRFVGEFSFRAQLFIPSGAVLENRGTSCADRPKWPTEGYELDVSLIDIGFVQDRGSLNEGGLDYEILTPSARLKNDPSLDAADVAWHRKFTGTFEPYDNDQHPYLIWNLYRVSDGRIEQIGASGVKHGFLTINVSCTLNCSNNHILWPGCEDVYGVGNNDSAGDLGPRNSEINPRTGVFESRGSFFDQNADGVQDNGSNAPGENRMKVLRSDLVTPGAEYFFEAWYIVRDDKNIFNTMGYHPVTPSGAGTNWSYSLGAFSQGPAADEWATPGGTPADGEMNETYVDAGVGHMKVLAKAEQLPDLRWQYSYFVMNYDVDHGIEAVAIESGASVSDLYFSDIDQEALNDWSAVQSGGVVAFGAPAGNSLTWGNGYSFGFVSEAAPTARQVTVDFGATSPVASATFDLLGPERAEAVFIDGFESP